MNSSEKWGDSVDAAVELALRDLKATKEEVDIEILEEPSKGFFGIGSKLAFVRVTKKDTEKKADKKSDKKLKDTAQKAKKEAVRTENKNTEQQEEKIEIAAHHLHFKKNHEKKPLSELVLPDGDEEEKIFSFSEDKKEKRYRFTHANREEEIEEELSPDLSSYESLPPDDKALTFLKKLIGEMGLEAEVDGKYKGKNLYLTLKGHDTGTLIGKRGVTLDAIQYLTGLAVNKGGGDYKRVVIDAENYRAKRRKVLEKLADRLAGKVIRSRHSYKLEPMNPYERKVIHAHLQKNPRVTTRSEGQDPYRRVIIELK